MAQNQNISNLGQYLAVNTAANTVTLNTKVELLAVTANGSLGTANQVLVTNGTAVYWGTSGFANGQSISVNNFTLTGGFTANGSSGLNGQVLVSNGSSTYWSSTAGAVSLVNEQFTANGTANAFTITGGYEPYAIQVYVNGVKQLPNTDVDISSGVTVNFPSVVPNTHIVDVFGYQITHAMPRYVSFVYIDNQFTGNGSVNTYTLTTSTTTNNAIVAINGVEQVPSVAYTISGNQLVFTGNVSNGSIVDVRIPTFQTTSSGITASYANYTYTASNGQTTFTGSDNNGRIMSYLPGESMVFLNGIKIAPTVDYVATTGNTVVLTTAAANNDVLEVVSISGMVATEGDTYSNNIYLASNTAAFAANNLTTSNTSQQNVDSFSMLTYRSASYFAQVTDNTNNNYHVQNISLVHNGSTVWMSEFGAVYSNGSVLATFDAEINSNNVVLKVTPVVANSTIKVVRTTVTV